MKTYIKIKLVLIALIFASCTDVVDVNVPEAEPRLVIEASLDWEKGTAGNEQTIKLSLSSPYFTNTVNPIVTGASVVVTNDNDGTEFIFEDQNNGNYTTTNFVPVVNQSYTLQVVYLNETYIAHETLMAVSDIDEISQSREGGFDKDLLEVNIYYNDPIDEENFYLIRYIEEGDILPYIEDASDEFTNGNRMTDFFEKENDEDINQKEFESGDIVYINLFGISEQYHNFIRLLINQYDSVGNPFDSTPVTLKGNCQNINNPSNYAFGYFRLTQVVKASYTFQ